MRKCCELFGPDMEIPLWRCDSVTMLVFTSLPDGCNIAMAVPKGSPDAIVLWGKRKIKRQRTGGM